MTLLLEKIRALAASPILLVACDFDGTLAPIVNNPSDAKADEQSLLATAALANMPFTHGSVISGRSLEDLSVLVAGVPRLWLVGSHGAELDVGSLATLPPRVTELLARVRAEVVRASAGIEGLLIEDKPAGVALHYRNADPAAAGPVLESILEGPATWDGVVTRPGKMVVELSVTPGDKGRALASIRHRVGATSVFFAGDDRTDEDAFGVLGPSDIGIKIGPGVTRAEFRIDSAKELPAILARLMLQRNEWLQGRDLAPLHKHSLLSDLRTTAIVDPKGRIVWLCQPRIDSPALFAELLGGASRGYFDIRSLAATSPPVQRYHDDTFVLETRWRDLIVNDFMDCSVGRPFQRAGRTDLLRSIERSPDAKGLVKAVVRFAPRLDFGRVATRLVVHPDGVEVEGATDPISLFAPGLEWKIIADGQSHTAEAVVEVGDAPIVLELRFGTSSLRPSVTAHAERLGQTQRFWSGWAATLNVGTIRPDLVRRSALVLKALCHGPTGAIAAAATTSLPEQIGGVRNWDYRYCWPRDASQSAASLVRLGNTGTAMKLLDWLTHVVFNAESPDRLRPIYDVVGKELGTEAEIGDLMGYGNSRPVRVGNAAASQVQLDVFGPIVDLIAMLAERGAPITPESWRLVEAMVNAVAARWMEPDHGIWEVRGPKQHHVHSKVMCWHAVSRAIVVAELFTGRPRAEWLRLRDEIMADVWAKGYNPGLNCFTGVYSAHHLDAAVLVMGLSGMIAPHDPRYIGTVEAIDKGLRHGPTVYRYRDDDGLPGVEGGLHICTFWLVEALALIGERQRAHDLFEAAVNLVGPTGMMTEEWDPELNMALGNTPQAYSHLGLINAAVRLGLMDAPQRP